MSSEQANLTLCFTCNEKTEKKRIDRFMKEFENGFVEIKIFECQNCKHHTCSIQRSSWKPKSHQDNSLETTKLASEDTT